MTQRQFDFGVVAVCLGLSFVCGPGCGNAEDVPADGRAAEAAIPTVHADPDPVPEETPAASSVEPAEIAAGTDAVAVLEESPSENSVPATETADGAEAKAEPTVDPDERLQNALKRLEEKRKKRADESSSSAEALLVSRKAVAKELIEAFARGGVGKRLVTQEQWKGFMGTNPSKNPGIDRPVDSVSWNEVDFFIRTLNNLESVKRARLKFRLPQMEEAGNGEELDWEWTTEFVRGSDSFVKLSPPNLRPWNGGANRNLKLSNLGFRLCADRVSE